MRIVCSTKDKRLQIDASQLYFWRQSEISTFAEFLEMRSEHLLRTKHVDLLSNRPYIFTSHHYNHNEKLHDRCQSGQTPFNIGYDALSATPVNVLGLDVS